MKTLKIEIDGLHIATFDYISEAEAASESMQAGWYMLENKGVAAMLGKIGMPLRRVPVFPVHCSEQEIKGAFSKAFPTNEVVMPENGSTWKGIANYLQKGMGKVLKAAQNAHQKQPV